jgi:hypothetical protein
VASPPLEATKRPFGAWCAPTQVDAQVAQGLVDGLVAMLQARKAGDAEAPFPRRTAGAGLRA